MSLLGDLHHPLARRRFEPDPADTSLIYVYLPEKIEPDARYDRYQTPLDAELRLSELGLVSGGGSMLDADEADGMRGMRGMLWCGIDVEAVDVHAARALLRQHLPQLGCRPGTRLEHGEGEGRWYDEYDGDRWVLQLPLPSAEDLD